MDIQTTIKELEKSWTGEHEDMVLTIHNLLRGANIDLNKLVSKDVVNIENSFKVFVDDSNRLTRP